MTKSRLIWLILPARLFLFAFFQALIAFIFFLSGAQEPWHSSEGWWTFSALLTNLVTILLLISLFRSEGTGYLIKFRFTSEGWWKDLLIAIILLVIMAPVSQLPNTFFAKLLFGSADTANTLFFRPLPLWAIIISFLFPLTHIFAELPLYFGYAMPRLEIKLKNGWYAWLIASFFLALQHITLPLIFNLDFILWRGLMFIPLALFIGLCIKIRPTLLPYFMIGHGLIDAMLIIMILTLN